MMAEQINWDTLRFELTPTKTMYVANKIGNKPWIGDFCDFGPLPISPAAVVLNYAQGVFEGMKAQRNCRNEIVMFRPQDNAERLNQSAQRVCIPPIPTDDFLKSIYTLVEKNKDFIPPYGRGSLYIRPCIWGVSAQLGVASSKDFTLAAYCSPVGDYYKSGLQAIALKICRDFHRAAPKGTGSAKYIGNYAATLLPKQQTHDAGFDECLFLDAKNDCYLEETATANFFCIKDNILMTPKLGSILAGITRDSIIQLASHLGLNVKEDTITIDDLFSADECFLCGTAVIITPVASISDGGTIKTFDYNNIGPITQKLYTHLTHIQEGKIDDPFSWVTQL